jgi:hypothetical protein
LEIHIIRETKAGMRLKSVFINFAEFLSYSPAGIKESQDKHELGANTVRPWNIDSANSGAREYYIRTELRVSCWENYLVLLIPSTPKLSAYTPNPIPQNQYLLETSPLSHHPSACQIFLHIPHVLDALLFGLAVFWTTVA